MRLAKLDEFVENKKLATAIRSKDGKSWLMKAPNFLAD